MLGAVAIGAKAFGLFLRNQRQWLSKPMSATDVSDFKTALKVGTRLLPVGGISLIWISFSLDQRTQTCPPNNREYQLCSLDNSEYQLCSLDNSVYQLCSLDDSEYQLCSLDNSEYQLCSLDSGQQ